MAFFPLRFRGQSGWSLLGANPPAVLQANQVQKGFATQTGALCEGVLYPAFKHCTKPRRFRPEAFLNCVIGTNQRFKFRMHPRGRTGP